MAGDETSPAALPERGWLPAVGWACFLGSSWTWVIGMFWPILLLRDFGPWGWLVFAVPNVVGAAAMGFVLSSPARSERVVARHRPAIMRFSEATLAFHFFAITWLLGDRLGLLPLLVLIALGVGCWVVARSSRWARVAGAAGWVLSLGVFAAFVWRGEAAWVAPAPERPMIDLALLAPAIVVGFALCPYLDATFHRARQATEPATGRLAFTLGFGGVFLAMIVFSYAYAGGFATLGEPAVRLLAVHWVVQAGYTVGLHLREANRDPSGLTLSPRLVLPAIVGVGLGYLAVRWPEAWVVGVSASTGETIYRGFLLLYGMVFPAYVWLVMLPTRRAVSHPVKVATFIFAAITALPMAAGAFVGGVTWWAPVAVGVLVAARLAVGVMRPRVAVQ